jgi:chemotaxis protein CheD
MPEHIIIRTSEYSVGMNGDILRTNSLGSCVAIIFYDPIHRIGGLSHILLSESPKDFIDATSGKYVDTALPTLLESMINKGADPKTIKAMLFGGSEMFHFFSLKIGHNNIEAAYSMLKKMNIPIVYQNTGGVSGRSVEINCGNGLVKIHHFGKIDEFNHF